jgi:hypothetical protein
MSKNDEGYDFIKSSSPAEKRNAQALAGLFTGRKKLVGLRNPAQAIDGRQRRACVDALLRSRRIWNPTDLELIAGMAGDSIHLRCKGAEELGGIAMRAAIDQAMATENFELALQLIGDDAAGEHAAIYQAARKQITQLHGLHDLLIDLKAGYATHEGRKAAFGMMKMAPVLRSTPLSTRAERLQVAVNLHLRILLAEYDQALSFAMAIRATEGPVSSLEVMRSHFQCANLAIILGDIAAAKSDLGRLMALEVVGEGLRAYRLSEHIILAFVIAIEQHDIPTGRQALGLMDRWVTTDVTRIARPRHARMLFLALQFTVLAMLPNETMKLLERHGGMMQGEDYHWCAIAEACHWWLHFDWELLVKALGRIRRSSTTETGLFLVRAIQSHTAPQGGMAREKLLRELRETASELPARERSNMDMATVIGLKMGMPWVASKRGDLSAASL